MKAPRLNIDHVPYQMQIITLADCGMQRTATDNVFRLNIKRPHATAKRLRGLPQKRRSESNIDETISIQMARNSELTRGWGQMTALNIQARLQVTLAAKVRRRNCRRAPPEHGVVSSQRLVNYLGPPCIIQTRPSGVTSNGAGCRP